MSTTYYALCWKLSRTDGVTLGFTNHDQDIVRSDGIYRAVPGFTPSAVATSDGLDVDNFQLAGALSHAAITEQDLWSGRYDGARLSMFLVDWKNPATAQDVAHVMLGDVQSDGNSFQVETLGATSVLERSVVETISPECRAQLGDKRCKFALRHFTRIAAVQSVAEADIQFSGLVPEADFYAYGSVVWLTGRNSGFVSAILASQGQTITLREPPPFAITVGTLAKVQAGCDKRFATCQTKFNNKANFRGEPYVPGIDSLIRYPGL